MGLRMGKGRREGRRGWRKEKGMGKRGGEGGGMYGGKERVIHSEIMKRWEEAVL